MVGNEDCGLHPKRIPSARSSQGEQNGATLSFVLPSSEEL